MKDTSTSQQPGTGRLQIEMSGGKTAITSLWNNSPLKILAPRSRGKSVWAYTGTLGGGLLAGDQIDLQIDIKEASRCFLGTQASTKIYRNHHGRPATSRLHATLSPGSLLVLAPDPVQPFAHSIYHQQQMFDLHATSTLVMVDWVSSGRIARDERWQFTDFKSRNEIRVDQKRLLIDMLSLNAEQGPMDGTFRLGRFNCVALLIVVGTLARDFAQKCLTDAGNLPIAPRTSLMQSASPIANGLVLRIAGEKYEEVAEVVRAHLHFACELLDGDPWARKW